MTSRIPSSRSRGRRAGLTALLAGALVAGGSLVATSLPAGAATVVTDIGYIALRTSGATGTVSAYGIDGTAVQVGEAAQTLTGSKSTCLLSAPNPPQGSIRLLTFPGPKTSLANGSIGFAEKKTGTSCAQVNAPTETLTLTVPDGLDATLAVLDLELKQSAQVFAKATSTDGVDTYFELRSGASIDTPSPLPGNVTVAAPSVCNNPADSGPDSGINDNCRWVIAGGEINSITLQAVQGAFSLEGGADGTVVSTSGPEPTPPLPIVNSSYFYFGGECDNPGSPVTISGSTQAGDGSSYTRYPVNADGSTCLSLPTELTRDQDGDLELAKPLGQPFEQGVVSAEWLADPNTAAENSTEVNFWSDKRSTGWVPLKCCPATLMNADGTVKWITGIVPANAVDQLDALGLTDQDQRTTALGNNNSLYQYACVVSRSTSYNGTQFETVDKIYMLGDVFIRR